MRRVKWQGTETPAETFLALLDGPVGAWPVISPASNGVQPDGTFRFTDHTGAVVTARPGDEIEIAPAGWILHAAN